jgi:hypothetical protein
MGEDVAVGSSLMTFGQAANSHLGPLRWTDDPSRQIKASLVQVIISDCGSPEIMYIIVAEITMIISVIRLLFMRFSFYQFFQGQGL